MLLGARNALHDDGSTCNPSRYPPHEDPGCVWVEFDYRPDGAFVMATTGSIEERLRRLSPVSAPEDQQAGVEELARVLQRAHRARRPARCKLVGPAGETIEVPESVFHVLERVAEVLARGDAVTIVPVGKELTTQQAADILNISRQYLVRLLDEGAIPFARTGKHRRLRVEDVLAFKEKRDHERKAALDELARQSEDVGGYRELG
ncbi:MAG: helix-turn-helix domain-containing protein [Planctomycetes bacterium]|nr:helix-turn-helix domain-containing protein [Planctomycetota bacterium]